METGPGYSVARTGASTVGFESDGVPVQDGLRRPTTVGGRRRAASVCPLGTLDYAEMTRRKQTLEFVQRRDGAELEKRLRSRILHIENRGGYNRAPQPTVFRHE